MTGFAFQRAFHAELHFHVLAAMDLPRDAASLYSGRNDSWAKDLARAYLRAPGRLVVQGLPLFTEDLEEMLGLLKGNRLRELSDPAGQELAALLAAILVAEAPSRLWRFEEATRTSFPGEWSRELEAVRAGLGATVPADLEVLDCPSLATREGSHGRSLVFRGRLRVAVGLDGPADQVACQLLHEVVHAATDPTVRAAHAGASHDTRADSAAFDLHRDLERAAIARGGELIESWAPRLSEPYRRWRRRHGA